jgi:hypothetical protein
MVDFLVIQGADPSIKDAPGRTAQEISNFTFLINKDD